MYVQLHVNRKSEAFSFDFISSSIKSSKNSFNWCDKFQSNDIHLVEEPNPKGDNWSNEHPQYTFWWADFFSFLGRVCRCSLLASNCLFTLHGQKGSPILLMHIPSTALVSLVSTCCAWCLMSLCLLSIIGIEGFMLHHPHGKSNLGNDVRRWNLKIASAVHDH